jgi:hypothetical protein
MRTRSARSLKIQQQTRTALTGIRPALSAPGFRRNCIDFRAASDLIRRTCRGVFTHRACNILPFCNGRLGSPLVMQNRTLIPVKRYERGMPNCQLQKPLQLADSEVSRETPARPTRKITNGASATRRRRIHPVAAGILSSLVVAALNRSGHIGVIVSNDA